MEEDFPGWPDLILPGLNVILRGYLATIWCSTSHVSPVAVPILSIVEGTVARVRPAASRYDTPTPYPAVQIGKPTFQSRFILAPCHAIHSGRSSSLQSCPVADSQ